MSREELYKMKDKVVDDAIKNATLRALDDLPDYFWSISSSSTGKYHPKFSLGDGGLVRHTLFAVEIAVELFNIVTFSNIEKDIIISSLILHDGRKLGNNPKYMDKNHADFQANYLATFWSDLNFNGRDDIIECIRTHMGQWGQVKPRNKVEQFVHTCDYIASRKLYDKYYEGE